MVIGNYLIFMQIAEVPQGQIFGNRWICIK